MPRREITRSLLAAFVLTVGIYSFAQGTAACSYKIFADPSAPTTFPMGINRCGNVVGYITGSNGTFGFIRCVDGTFKHYMAPGADATEFFRRNAIGVTVGVYENGSLHGLGLSGSRFQSVDHPGAIGTVLTGINTYSTIVGYYMNTSYHDVGFRLKDGIYTAIQYPGAADTLPSDISDNGTVVGSYGDSQGNSHGFVLTNGIYTTVDDPYAQSGTTTLSDINRNGIIVGNATTGILPQGFRIRNGLLENLKVPNAQYTVANGINRHGVITGAAFFPGGYKGYIAHCRYRSSRK